MATEPEILFRLLMAALAVGVALGGLYDVLRISRIMVGMSHYTGVAKAPAFSPKFCKARLPKTEGRRARVIQFAVLAAEDFLFCLLVGAAVAVLLFAHNDGEFRWFVLLGLLLGFGAYYFTMGKLIVRVSEYVIFCLKIVILYAVYYITFPFVALGRLIVKGAVRLIRRIREQRAKKAICHYTKQCHRRLTEAAERGFFP